ncbi:MULTISPECIES: hypothetical protein [Microbacterium]|uniref:hypothetical protein n=1 Tax=Microbacterium TaxID=33882 RepID=UPI00217F0085|nr:MULTISPECIES: hypothetical protein [Microbacterium]UWF77960.1 hypothetical protein JSY13_02580 [Microbacterium neungamense]WCM56137.1 hypothetical protein JRG78_02625 [Microbacterium sp. EF45047]
MDPFLLAELWWIAPAAAGATGLGVAGMRYRGRQRRIAVDAARSDLVAARRDAAAADAGLRLARARLDRAVAERAGAGELAQARAGVRDAEDRCRSAAAQVRVRRAQLRAARAEYAAKTDPVARVRDAHDAVLARWMEYETDPARLIAFPRMSDGRAPEMAAFHAARARAADARPDAGAKRLTPAGFAAYRDAVEDLERAFAAAEQASGAAPPVRPAWQDAAQHAIERGAGALRIAADAWVRRRRS